MGCHLKVYHVTGIFWCHFQTISRPLGSSNDDIPYLHNSILRLQKWAVDKLLHLVESNTEKNLKISVFGGSKVNLVKFVTANVSFGEIGKICYCKYQFW